MMVNPGIMKVNKLINPAIIVTRMMTWAPVIMDGDNPMPLVIDSRWKDEQALNGVSRRMLNIPLGAWLNIFFFNDF